MMTGFLRELPMITEPQANWLKSLVRDKVVPEKWQYEANLLAGEYWRGQITRKQASEMIDVLKDARKKPKEGSPAKVELTDGMYRKDGVVFKVYHTVHGANQQVAKRLVVTREGVRLPEPVDGEFWEIKPEAEFVYEGKAGLKGLLPEHALSLEEAKKFGLVYGVCCRCSRTLTREESIEAGIGPVCAGKEF